MNGVNRSARRAAMRKSGKARHLAAASAVAVTGLLGSYLQVLRAPSAYATTNCAAVTNESTFNAALTAIDAGTCDVLTLSADITLTGNSTVVDLSSSGTTAVQVVGNGHTISGASAGVATYQALNITLDETDSLVVSNLTISHAEAAKGGGLTVVGATSGSVKTSVTLTDVTFDHCVASGSGNDGGGAVYAIDVDFTLGGTSAFSYNDATGTGGGAAGGAIALWDANAGITGATFSHNVAHTNGAVQFMASSSASRGDLTISDSTFSDNQTDWGSGLYFYGDTLSMDSVEFHQNDALNGGGALYFSGSSGTVTNSTFDTNSTSSVGSNGAGIYASVGSLSISDSYFSNNTSKGGAAGIFSWHATLTIADSAFAANLSYYHGAAVYLDQPGYPLAVSGSTFSDNHAGNVSYSGMAGGAIYSKSDLTVTGSAFDNNSATGEGGAIATRPPGTYVLVDRSTFFANSAESYGGALYLTGDSRIVNSFVSGNASLGYMGVITDDGHELTIDFSTLVDNYVSANLGDAVVRATDIVANGSVIADTTGASCYVLSGGTTTDTYAVATDGSCGLTGVGSVQNATSVQLDLSPRATQAVGASTQSFRAPGSGSILLTGAPTSDLSTGVTVDQLGTTRSGTFAIGSIQPVVTPPSPPAPPAASGGGGSSVSAPGAPTGVLAVPGAANARVSWQPPASNGGSAVTRYVVTAGPGGAWCAVDAPATSCVVNGLTAGTSYTFTVVAYNAVAPGPGAVSNAVTPVAATDPLGPTTPHGPGLLPAGGLSAGASLLLVDGAPVPVTVAPNHAVVSKATGLSITGPGFTMTLAGRGDVNDPLGLTAKQALVLQSEPVATRAGVVRRMLSLAQRKVQPAAQSTGTGFKPNTPVKFFLLADTYLGTLATDADGGYSGTVPIPAGIRPGMYTLQVNGFAPSGEVRSLSIGVQVIEATTARATRTAEASVFFASMSAQLTAAGQERLDRLVVKTGRNGVKTVVVGYVQPAGGTANDQWLSRQRAQAVAQYLRGKGLKGAYVVRGAGRATQAGAKARRVDVTVAYRK